MPPRFERQNSTTRILGFGAPLLLLLIVAMPLRAYAQDTVTGAFEGTISDSQTGAALKGALVEIINQQTGVAISLRADYRGRFYQGLLLPGVYRIRVSTSGYQPREVIQRLKITYTGEVVPVPVALDPAPTAGVTAPAPTPTPALSVEVTDIRAGINRLDGRRSGSFADKDVVTLPLGGVTVTSSFDELALLLPGVAPPPQALGSVAGPGVGAGVGSAGQFSVNGLRSRGNNFTVDGSDNNDEDIGVRRQGFVALIPQPIESVQEYQVITLLAPAQFGRNLGGQVNAVSKSGGSQTHGTVYGTFNSSQLNARNFFDTTFGTATTTVRANNQDVMVQTRNAAGQVTSQQPLSVRNESAGKDSFTFWRAGFVIGGPVKKDKAFYFASFESSATNATEEHSFAVPTIEQRGAFGTGTTGIFQNPFTGQPTATIPGTRTGSAIFSLYPFPNNPRGVYGANTLTQVLPASGRGVVLSGKLDDNFKINQREQSVTGRYNFTNDWREIPTTGDAIFSTLKPRIRTHNFSFFLNSKLSGPNSAKWMFNQVRLSYGRTRLRFDEVRDTRTLIPSSSFPDTPFLLNAPDLLNITTPPAAGVPYTSQVIYVRQPITTEQDLGPLGQVVIAGFSPVGVDVYNFPQQRVNNTYQVADNLTLRVKDHSYTFGADIRRSELNSDLPRNSRPLATFNGAPRLVFENGAFRFPVSSDLNQFIRGVDLAAMGAASNSYLTLSTVSGDARISLRYYQLNFFGGDEWRVRPRLALSLGLRYEYNTPVRELNSRIENTFNDPALNLAPALRQFITGRTAIYDSDRNNLAPRFGFAYSPQPFGPNHLTVIRGGFGLFYDQILGAVVSQSRNVYPTFVTLNFGGLNASVSETPLNFFNPGRTILSTSAGQFVTLAQPGTLNRLNPLLTLDRLFDVINNSFPNALGATLPSSRLQMPSATHYDLMIEQQLDRNLVVSAAYVGTQGRHLLRFTTPNLGPASTIVPSSLGVFQDQFANPAVRGRVRAPSRPVAGVGAINRFETTANSSYNSLQIQLRGRWRRSLQYQAAYTLSSANDDVSDVFDLAGAPALPQDSMTFSGERGPANFDSRHRLAYGLIYDFPKAGDNNLILRALTNDVQVSSTGRLSAGQPFTVNSIFDVNLDGNLTDRLNTTNGLVNTGNRRQPLLLTVPSSALLAPVGSNGAVGRNTFRAGGLVELDLAASKRIQFTGGQALHFRIEIFNVINRANFGIPVRYLEAPGFGQATSTTTPGRRVQFSLKYSF
jgi:hypothetical protein